MNEESINQAIALYHSQTYGVLSTLSRRLNGYPFGSVVPYGLDGQGKTIVLLSAIAEHSKNISTDQRCSLTITEGHGDVQSNARLCIVGDMKALPDEDSRVQQRYYRYFSKARRYREVLDFSFYRLHPVAIRFIAGFGAVYWIEPSDFVLTNPFYGKAESAIVDHMNADHHTILRNYCEYYKKMSITDADTVRMAGIDGRGFDVMVNARKVRFEFERPVSTAEEARKALIKLSKDLG